MRLSLFFKGIRQGLFFWMGLGLCFFLWAQDFPFGFGKDKTTLQKSFQELEANYRNLKGEFDRLKQEYEALKTAHQTVVLDRDNLLTQLKKQTEQGQRVLELEEAVEVLKKERFNLEEELKEAKKGLEQGNQRMDNLLGQIKDLELVQKQLLVEREQLQEALEQERSKSGIKALEEKNLNLQNENLQLSQKINDMQKELERRKKKEAEELKKAEKEIENLKKRETQYKELVLELRAKEKELNSRLNEALQKNKLLEKKVATAPTNFMELARQNKTLIKNNANMHYNLGVFYLKQKEYNRAIAEFERAVELNPQDASAHFNLGYIYAQHLVHRRKAIEHFRKYLQYASPEDKDVDWVKKYIITWQAWQGDKAVD